MTSCWDDWYASEDYIFGRTPNAFLASRQADLPSAGTALALADGEGRNGVWLAEQGLDVTTIDAAPIALEKAKRLADERQVSLVTICSGLMDWDLGQEQWDVVVGIFMQVIDSADRRMLHRRIIKSLKPGGMLILQGYTPDQLAHGTGGPSDPDRLYTAAQLVDEFAGLTIRHLAEVDRDLQEGTAHVGRSAVVELVAVKSVAAGS